MYSRVSVCKTCFKRVLDEQLKLEPKNSCIYCLVSCLKHKVDDLTFANQILEKNLADLGEAYQGCLNLLTKYTEEKKTYKIDPNSLIG